MRSESASPVTVVQKRKRFSREKSDCAEEYCGIHVFCTESLAHDYRKTRSQALGKTYNHEAESGCRSDGCERINADEASDDDRIDHAVKLLEEIPYEERDRE